MVQCLDLLVRIVSQSGQIMEGENLSSITIMLISDFLTYPGFFKDEISQKRNMKKQIIVNQMNPCNPPEQAIN
jgi:hypothetical protein